MISSMQTLALIELSISCAVIVIWMLQKFSTHTFPFGLKLVLVLLIGNLVFWPLGFGMELPLVAYVRGVTGDLSIILTLLLWSSLLPENKSTPQAFKLAITIIAICFYPLALGWGMIDPYVWGYGNMVFLTGALVFAVICAFSNWTKGTWIIAFSIVAWSIYWHESSNLWDYLLDPILAMWTLLTLIGAFYRKCRAKA
jgi:hypothetical protein